MCVCVSGEVIFHLKPILLVGFSSPGLTTSCKSIFFPPISPSSPCNKDLFPKDPSPKRAGLVLPILFQCWAVMERGQTDRKGGQNGCKPCFWSPKQRGKGV